MLDFPRWKQVWLWTLSAVFALAALPSIFAVAGLRWPAALPAPRVNLGLDLAGGSHLLLEADTAQLVRQRLETKEEEVRNALKRSDKPIAIGDISALNDRLSFMVQNPAQVDAVRDLLLPLTSGAGLSGQRDWDLQVVDGSRFEMTPTQAGLDQAVTQAMDTATEVVRKRIDALGTREPTIIRSGAQRIVSRFPGSKIRLRSKTCWGRPPSSNSSWSI